jgi:hypothetical protein
VVAGQRRDGLSVAAGEHEQANGIAGFGLVDAQHFDEICRGQQIRLAVVGCVEHQEAILDGVAVC